MKKHCCKNMDKALVLTCEHHDSPHDCPDQVLSYSPKFDEYGLIIHDGGSSEIEIKYCPWCGKSLPDSKRDLWFDTLDKLGFDDPSVQDIPSEFRSDAWYINK